MSRKNPQILRYINKKGWEYTEVDNQFQITVCPYCGTTDGKFYINSITGQFTCFKGSCGKSGNLYTLKKDLNDIQPIAAALPNKSKLTSKQYGQLRKKIARYHQNLLEDGEILTYVENKWDFNLDIVKEFNLGLQRSSSGKWLVIPHYVDKIIANAKFRSLPPQEKVFKRVKGMESTLFNIDNVDTTLPFINVCEGESDTITLHRLGFQNVVGVTVGARGIKPEWKDFFDTFEKIYTFYDPDIAGQDGAKKMSKRLGMTKCYNVTIPTDDDGENLVTDLTDYVKAGNGKEDVEELISKSKLFDIEDVTSFRSALDDLETKLFLSNKIDDGNLKTPWSSVNKLVGSFVPGDLIILSGNAKIGKSTLALDLIINYIRMGIPSLYYCLEMRPERIVTKAISNLRLIDRSEITKDDVVYVRMRYGGKPFYLAHSYKFTAETVFETIRESVIRYGIEFLCFDHLHFLVRSTTNVSNEVGHIVREFKLLAEELAIPIMLIAQPRKLQGTKARMTTNDLRDSSAIGQDADTVMIVHRDRLPKSEGKTLDTAIFSPIAEIIVDATRYNPGGVAKLYFDGAFSKYFTNLKERNLLSQRGG